VIRLLPLSRGCQYAIRTVAHLSHKPQGTIFPRQEISRQTKIPLPFLAKILQVLNRAGVLRSHRGLQRGYSINRPASQITLLDVVAAYDGPFDSSVCLMDGHKLCPGGQTCAVHPQLVKLQNQAVKILSSTTVSDWAKILPKRYSSHHWRKR